MRCLVLGTDTGVGKTTIAQLLVAGLRAGGRRVWVHKPVACGDWDGTQADDGRTYAALVGDGQDPATACPFQWPEPASPHLAAAAAGQPITGADLDAVLTQLERDAERAEADLIIEGAGGPLVPLTSDLVTAMDLAQRHQLPCLLVTRPHLGTLNHTGLAIEALRRRELSLLGVVVNHHDMVERSLATDTVTSELERLWQVPVLAEIGYADTTQHKDASDLLARVVVTAHGHAVEAATAMAAEASPRPTFSPGPHAE